MANFRFFSELFSLNTALNPGQSVSMSTGILSPERSGLQVLVTVYVAQSPAERAYVTNVNNVNVVRNTTGAERGISLNYRITNLTQNQPVQHFAIHYLAIWP